MADKLLALDLSLSSTGYAVTERNPDGTISVIEVGHIDNKKQGRSKWSHGKKLERIHNELCAVFDRHPDISRLVREQGFSRHNRATQALFRVVGIADYIAEIMASQSITEYSVPTVKKAITGDGRADKQQVADEVLNYLSEKIEFAVDDESDAVAVAVCHYLKEN